MSIKLLSNAARVETPFISVQIGDYNFGVFNKQSGADQYISAQKLYYPNFVHRLSVSKVNGAINTYTLTLVYQITPGDDPNFLEKVFSQRSRDRRMILSYGDYSSPSFLYKQEACTITNVKSSIDFNSSAITYTVTAISDALSLNAGTFSFPKRVAQPSSVLKEILVDDQYGVLEVFYGMRNQLLVDNYSLIPDDDAVVTVEAKVGISVLEYINYLVSCMKPKSSSSSSVINSGRYTLVVYDDYSGELGGPYFKVSRVDTSVKSLNSLDTYEVDIGYPGDNLVMSFSVDDDQTYAILYDYSQKMNQPNYVYRINDEGRVESMYSPVVSNNTRQFKTTAADSTWWTSVTQYPIKATLVVRGLLRSAFLMTYVKINAYFYGQKHISSGVYVITKQVDDISSEGYRTTLSLTRIQGDQQ